MAKSISLGKQRSRDDEWLTPSYAVNMLAPFIKPKTKIWEPFIPAKVDDSLIEIVTSLRKLGHTVKTTATDFFKTEVTGCDLVISNPPYTTNRGERNMKERIIERLCDLNIPFCLLLPTYYLHTKSFLKMKTKYGESNFGLVMPSRKIQFYKLDDKNNKTKTLKGCSFYTTWLCYRFDLPTAFVVI
jgi:hypothetical protein